MTNHFDPIATGFEAFQIHDTPLDESRTLRSVAIESKDYYAGELPADWQDRLEAEVRPTDLLVPEYFMPEVAVTSHSGRLLGRVAARYSEKHHQVYEFLADAAADAGVPVAVVDPANRTSFLAFDSLLPIAAMYVVASVRDKGIAGREPDMAERIVPSGTDARRMITAAGIRQVAAGLPKGGNMLYVAAPAHVRRVLGFLTTSYDALDTMRYAAYKTTMSRYMYVRTYGHDPATGWQPTGRVPIE